MSDECISLCGASEAVPAIAPKNYFTRCRATVFLEEDCDGDYVMDAGKQLGDRQMLRSVQFS
ncbi:hypothetical protein ACW14Y_41390 [Kitasatospora sp. cg17-2]